MYILRCVISQIMHDMSNVQKSMRRRSRDETAKLLNLGQTEAISDEDVSNNLSDSCHGERVVELKNVVK